MASCCRGLGGFPEAGVGLQCKVRNLGRSQTEGGGEEYAIGGMARGGLVVALDKILSIIRELPKKDRTRLLGELKRWELKDRAAAERFEKAAGGWPDFDAEGFIAETYARRVGRREADVGW